jgi:hypothetical protein
MSIAADRTCRRCQLAAHKGCSKAGCRKLLSGLAVSAARMSDAHVGLNLHFQRHELSVCATVEPFAIYAVLEDKSSEKKPSQNGEDS